MRISSVRPGILECLTKSIFMIVVLVGVLVFQSNRVARMRDRPSHRTVVECLQRSDQSRAHVG